MKTNIKRQVDQIILQDWRGICMTFSFGQQSVGGCDAAIRVFTFRA